MTKSELIASPHFKPEIVALLSAYLRANSRVSVGTIDPTILIRNEGRMQGVHDAADILDRLLQPEVKPEQKREQQLYPDPSNLNRK